MSTLTKKQVNSNLLTIIDGNFKDCSWSDNQLQDNVYAICYLLKTVQKYLIHRFKKYNNINDVHIIKFLNYNQNLIIKLEQELNACDYKLLAIINETSNHALLLYLFI